MMSVRFAPAHQAHANYRRPLGFTMVTEQLYNDIAKRYGKEIGAQFQNTWQSIQWYKDSNGPPWWLWYPLNLSDAVILTEICDVSAGSPRETGHPEGLLAEGYLSGDGNGGEKEHADREQAASRKPGIQAPSERCQSPVSSFAKGQNLRPSTDRGGSSCLGWVLSVMVILFLSIKIEVALYQSHLKRVTTSIMKNMVFIPSGSFLMGSPSSEKGPFNEGSQHRVSIPRGFWMGKYEVTQEQWKAIMGKGNNPSCYKGDNLPVERVSWNDVQDFIQKLNAKTGKHFRLPTEAEWEYACRAGTTTAYCFGDSAGQLPQYAWYDENSGQQAHPVGQKKPNAWGLYDMYGNVLEWCQDRYGNCRVYRGGSCFNDEWECRSAYRYRLYESDRDCVLGFRLARDE